MRQQDKQMKEVILILKKFALFMNSIIGINNIQIDNAKDFDVVMPI